ncbi:unnamed protein product, partial [Amoebophrya sp. A120]|eukprot:GSA120T00025306001.1
MQEKFLDILAAEQLNPDYQTLHLSHYSGTKAAFLNVSAKFLQYQVQNRQTSSFDRLKLWEQQAANWDSEVVLPAPQQELLEVAEHHGEDDDTDPKNQDPLTEQFEDAKEQARKALVENRYATEQTASEFLKKEVFGKLGKLIQKIAKGDIRSIDWNFWAALEQFLQIILSIFETAALFFGSSFGPDLGHMSGGSMVLSIIGPFLRLVSGIWQMFGLSRQYEKFAGRWLKREAVEGLWRAEKFEKMCQPEAFSEGTKARKDAFEDLIASRQTKVA